MLGSDAACKSEALAAMHAFAGKQLLASNKGHLSSVAEKILNKKGRKRFHISPQMHSELFVLRGSNPDDLTFSHWHGVDLVGLQVQLLDAD